MCVMQYSGRVKQVKKQKEEKHPQQAVQHISTDFAISPKGKSTISSNKVRLSFTDISK